MNCFPVPSNIPVRHSRSVSMKKTPCSGTLVQENPAM